MFFKHCTTFRSILYITVFYKTIIIFYNCTVALLKTANSPLRHIHLIDVFAPEFGVYGSASILRQCRSLIQYIPTLESRRERVVRVRRERLRKPAHCKFKGRTFSATFFAASNSTNACSLSEIPQPTIYALGRCQPLLNDSLYGHLHMKKTTTVCVFYGQSYALIGERERANLVVQLGRAVVIYIYIYIYIVRRRRAPGVYDVNIP